MNARQLGMIRPLLLTALAAALWVLPVALRGAEGVDPADGRAGDAVVKMFRDGLFEQADQAAAEYLRTHPSSERLPEIVLIQAQSRLKLDQPDAALALLEERGAAAGRWADEFAFWRAVARSAKGELAPAADAFAAMAAAYPASARRTEALYNEAFARSRLGDEARAVTLLRAPEGAFQIAARAGPRDEWATRGWLLLAELLLRGGDLAGATAALQPLAEGQLSPALEWQRRYLAARLDLASNRLVEALTQVTNLWTTATNSVRSELVADAVMIEGEIEERLGRTAEALGSYERDLAANVPEALRREALRRSVELGVRANQLPDTVARLERFLAQSPPEALRQLARLALGEVRLRQYHQLKPGASNAEAQAAATNLLQRARADLDMVLSNQPPSALLGRVQFQRGWTFWEEGTNRLAEGAAAFGLAADLLPRSADQGVARFKLADSLYLLGDHAGAISNYWLVATNYTGVPGLTNQQSSQALYQIVRAAVDGSNLAAAAAAMAILLETDPTGELAASSGLLTGQALGRQGQPEAARALYESFTGRFTNSPILPEVRLAIAHTYEQQQQWPAARNAYSSWLEAYGGQTNVSPTALAQATFELARLNHQTQPDAASLAGLTNFVARFPESPNAPLAQYLAGEYFYNQGDFARAELAFQSRVLAQNPAAMAGGLAYQARLMAGRAAVALRSYRSAREHFDWVITNGPLHMAASTVPVPLVAEAYLFRGDTLQVDDGRGDTNSLDRFLEAITTYSKVAERFPTNEYAPLAWGRIGDCQLQLATQDTNRYDLAAEAFQRVVDSGADATVRSQAEFKLAAVSEKQAGLRRPPPEQLALVERALNHLLRVLYGQNLRAGESPDPYWVKRAGLAAAELAEAQQKWELAIGLYRRLLTELPPLRPRLEKRIAELEKLKPGDGATTK